MLKLVKSLRFNSPLCLLKASAAASLGAAAAPAAPAEQRGLLSQHVVVRLHVPELGELRPRVD